MRDKFLSRSQETSKVSDRWGHDIKEDIPRVHTFNNAFSNKEHYPVSIAFNNSIKYSIPDTKLFLCHWPLLSFLFFPSFFRGLLKDYIFSATHVPACE